MCFLFFAFALIVLLLLLPACVSIRKCKCAKYQHLCTCIHTLATAAAFSPVQHQFTAEWFSYLLTTANTFGQTHIHTGHKHTTQTHNTHKMQRHNLQQYSCPQANTTQNIPYIIASRLHPTRTHTHKQEEVPCASVWLCVFVNAYVFI